MMRLFYYNMKFDDIDYELPLLFVKYFNFKSDIKRDILVINYNLKIEFDDQYKDIREILDGNLNLLTKAVSISLYKRIF